MPLLTEQLSVWEIGFRWAGHDPCGFWLRIPLPVRDHFRTLIQEIYESRLECLTLRMEKYHGHDPVEARLHIQSWLPAIAACTAGRNIDRKLVKWAVVDRFAFFTWCENHKIPLPEFWFPSGWGVEHECLDNEPPGGFLSPAESTLQRRIRFDGNRRAKMACQQIAIWIWSKHPDMPLKDVVLSAEIQDMCGGQRYEYTTVKHWIMAFDPHHAAKKP